jgi:hypothetical protein
MVPLNAALQAGLVALDGYDQAVRAELESRGLDGAQPQPPCRGSLPGP